MELSYDIKLDTFVSMIVCCAKYLVAPSVIAFSSRKLKQAMHLKEATKSCHFYRFILIRKCL